MEKWLVALDCQTFGVAHSMQLLAPSIQVDTRDLHIFRSDIELSNRMMDEYDRILVSPDVLQSPGARFDLAKDLMIVPQIFFEGFHPDSAAGMTVEGSYFKTPMDDYHSCIAIAAFNKGMGVSDALKLYNGKFYEKCGHLSYWDGAKFGCIKRFSDHGWDISQNIISWSRGACFMHSPNHPKVNCLYDLAKIILKSRGIEIEDGQIRPPDVLAYSAIYPVYPEIAEYYGVKGDLKFKPMNSFRTLSLEDFIRGSFEVYEYYKARHVAIIANNLSVYERVCAAM